MNDPYKLFDNCGCAVLPNCYFSPSGHLHTEFSVPAYKLEIPHEQNSISEFFVEYSDRDSYFKQE